MEALFSFYLPVFYLALYLTASLGSLLSRTANGFIVFCGLTLLYLCAWIDGIWYSSVNLMYADLLVLIPLLYLLKGRIAPYFSGGVFLMLISNGYFVASEGSEFWRLSLINILFVYLCVLSLVVSYNTHKSKGKGKSHEPFYAMQGQTKEVGKSSHGLAS
jgi:hypothetical protein